MGANQLNNLRIPVRDLVHDMAPVTPHSAEIQQDKAPLFLRLREDCVRPRLPIDGVLLLLAKRDVQREQQKPRNGAQVHCYTPNFVFSLRRSIWFINASIENKPGPNTRMIRAASRNANASALTNSSGSLKMCATASKSAARQEPLL